MSRIRIHAGIAALAAALLVTPVAISAQDTGVTATTTDNRDNDEGFDKGLLGLLGLLGLAGLRKKPDHHGHVDRDVHTTPGTTGGMGTGPGARRP